MGRLMHSIPAGGVGAGGITGNFIAPVAHSCHSVTVLIAFLLQVTVLQLLVELLEA